MIYSAFIHYLKQKLILFWPSKYPHGRAVGILKSKTKIQLFCFVLILDVPLDYFCCYFIPHCSNKVSISPKFPVPQNVLEMGKPLPEKTRILEKLLLGFFANYFGFGIILMLKSATLTGLSKFGKIVKL